MLSADIRGLDSVQKLLAGLEGKLADVGRLAQNKMAFALRAAEQDQMRKDLDRPTPFSVSSVLYKKAETSAAVLGGPRREGAAVYMVDNFARQGVGRVGPDQYLGVQVVGGLTAGPRRSEKVLQAAGILPADKVWVPASGVKLNAYGNLSGGLLSRMITDFGFNPYAQTKTKNFALFGPKGNPVGVLAKVYDGADAVWRPFLFFVDRPQYQARFDFYGRADREIAARFADIWGGYLDKALKKLA